jgi:MFS family permease
MFVGARIIIGLGAGVACVGASIYLAEMVKIQSRAFVLGFYWDATCMGLLIAAGISYGTQDIQSTWAWKVPYFIRVLPGFFALKFCPLYRNARVG